MFDASTPARTSVSELSATEVLTAVGAAQAEVWRLEARQLALAAHWADLHPADCLHAAAGFSNAEVGGSWSEHEEPIAGPGCPLVAEFCVAEFGAALGLSTVAAKRLIGQALELRHRLPRAWGMVQAGLVAPWRVRRIAEATIHANPALHDAAMSFLDREVAVRAGALGTRKMDQLIDDAILRFGLLHDPEVDHEGSPIEDSAETHFVHFDDQRVNSDGTLLLTAHLDLADGLALKHAVEQGAEAMKAAGSQECLGYRQAATLGRLARHHVTDAEPPSRPLTLNLHLTALRLSEEECVLDPVVHLEEGQRTVLVHQVEAWCAAAGATVRLQPVIDLNEELTAPRYRPSARQRTQITLRDQTCVFPWCTRTASATDLDHVAEYDPSSPATEPPQTRSSNLGCLCRRHHRLKTFGRWVLSSPSPGTFLWASPHGHRFIRRPDGTTEPCG